MALPIIQMPALLKTKSKTTGARGKVFVEVIGRGEIANVECCRLRVSARCVDTGRDALGQISLQIDDGHVCAQLAKAFAHVRPVPEAPPVTMAGVVLRKTVSASAMPRRS